MGKKSWNVYNTENIEKVRKDEAAAKLREEEEERRMQEVDSERRIQLLRGLASQPPSAPASKDDNTNSERTSGRERKRRRIAGEDDTDRDIRFAKENGAITPSKGEAQGVTSTRQPKSDAPLTDRNGHINLFPVEGSRHHVQKNPEAEAEAAKKKREYEDQYTMRFSNAAGFKQNLEKPWYSSVKKVDGPESDAGIGKDVWGNDDKGRKNREKLRMDSNDPLASMKKGVMGLREVEQERKLWKEKREREILGPLERSEERRGRARNDDLELDRFSLDISVSEGRPSNSDHGHRHQRVKRDRSQGGSLDRSRKHDRQRNSRERHRTEGGRRKEHSESYKPHRSSDAARSTTNDSMMRLRQERDLREIRERQKSASLLEKVREDARPGWKRHSGGRYSSQFSHE